MNPKDTAGLNCSGLPASERCDATLPDNPQCALNYHFGMLLGVEDFQTEQGFHVGRLRRHQRLLHGLGVVAGFPVSFDTKTFDLRVGPGYAVDALGRDLLLDTAQCVNLALWWQKHAADDDFHGLDKNDATFDLDLRVCYATCLDRPVPAIAEPCAGDAADIAHARLCETVTLSLMKHADPPLVPVGRHPFHLLRMWLGLDPAGTDADGKPLADDDWLSAQYAALEALPADQQAARRTALLQEVTARAVAATSPFAPDIESEAETCVMLARLRQVHVKHDGSGWTVTVGSAGEVDLSPRPVLLPSGLLQALLLAEPPGEPVPAGPVVVRDGASLVGTDVLLVFSQALALPSLTADAFSVSEFIEATGWKPFTLGSPTCDTTTPDRPIVTLPLDRAPTGKRLRITVIGTGGTPLLGSQWIPAGAPYAESDGRNLTTTLTL